MFYYFSLCWVEIDLDQLLTKLCNKTECQLYNVDQHTIKSEPKIVQYLQDQEPSEHLSVITTLTSFLIKESTPPMIHWFFGWRWEALIWHKSKVTPLT